ncbi:MAG: HlyD family efflux transporter periplasmic adaptor subunit [Acetatifactor sp.]
MAKKNSKVKKYRKPLNLNIGMIIFGVVFVYVVICVILYFQTGRIVRYEVKEGSLAADNVYRGIALRDETVIYTDAAGYVNYYAREGERVAKNDLVYIVDETGNLNEELEALNLGENSLSNKELAEFRNEIVGFAHGFDETSYESTYDFKYSLKNTVLKLANVSMLQSISDLNGGTGTNIINYSYAPRTGIVAYWTDGYETLTAEGVSESIFDEAAYEKNQMLGNSLMAAGDPAYKLSTNENWSIVVPIEAERGAKLQEEGYIKVRFLKNQYESWGATKLITGSDGNTYLQLSFTNSMITFLNDRFLDVELIVEDETGLKIPVSSIVQKEFFLIPEDFVIPGTSGGGDCIMRQCYLEDGTISSERLEIEVYNFDSESKEYYLDSSILNAGDILYKLDSQETYTVSKRATLIGVYNMNKGYADFKQINILYQNDEYAIVKSNTRYGLSVYDYIVLDAASVSDDQFINQ